MNEDKPFDKATVEACIALARNYKAWARDQLDLSARHDRCETAEDIAKALETLLKKCKSNVVENDHGKME